MDGLVDPVEVRAPSDAGPKGGVLARVVGEDAQFWRLGAEGRNTFGHGLQRPGKTG
jgi:hypothetical protein